MTALALTDHRSLIGAVEFYEACQGSGVNPILGLEFEVSLPPDIMAISKRGGRLVLLALDLSGWATLCHLSSVLQTDLLLEDDKVLPFERLGEFAEGVICLTGGRRGLINGHVSGGHKEIALSILGRINDYFPDRLYVELQKHTTQDEPLVERQFGLARHLNLPVVATHDVYYITEDHGEVQRLVSAIRVNQQIGQLSADGLAPEGAYFTDEGEMVERYSDIPDAIDATMEIALRCQLELPLGVPQYPEITTPEGSTPIELLRQKAEKGAKRIYGGITPVLQRRLDDELEVIGKLDYASLFLVMEEIINYAHRRGVPVSSRGSAASSLVAHCLGITSPDPISLNLYFERFLNPARVTPPDIDTDLCSRRRDGVIRYVYERYGRERVAMVCTVNRFRRRSALREVAKAHNLTGEEIKDLVDRLPHRWYRSPRSNSQREEPYAQIASLYTSELYKNIFKGAASLLGVPRHLSIHPGGIVIAPGRLTDLVPTQMATKGVVITQFDLKSIERLGLVKIDLLGIRGLTVLGDVAENVGSPPGEPPTSLEVLEAIPEEDAETAELVREGRTIGCFQIESPGMRATLKEIQAGNMDDLMVALALYRPGPLTGGLKGAFVRRHRGEEQADYLHPKLEPLLRDTYGVILYQEQVLQIAHELAGLSLVDSDLLRRAMSHFDPGKQMVTLKAKFIAGAVRKSGVPEDVAERVWELMAAFAGYGFPKAHAASYAQVAWRSAWCKAHYPALFMAAVLANWGGYYSQRVYLMEARRMGLKIRPPNINHAEREFSLRYIDGEAVLFMGFDQVRDLTKRTQKRILHEQPFHSLPDFIARVDPRPVEAENLTKVGALEGLGTIPWLLRQLEGGGWRGGQLSLFALEGGDEDDWPLDERVAAQETILGVGVDAHPLELVSEEIDSAGALNTVEAASKADQRIRVAGMRQIWRRFTNYRGERVYYMSLEDLEGMIDVVISASVYRRSQEQFSGRGPYIVEGTVELDEDSGEPFMRAERVWGIR
jgi:DNA polymerase-3 subunit alpha